MAWILRDLKLLRRMSWALTLAMGALLVIGAFFVFSACFVSEELPVRSLYRKQIMWSVVGLFCYIAFAATGYRRLGKVSWWVYGVTICLLLVVLVAGTRIYGARRWLVFLGITVQPSELAKLATLIVLAGVLSRPAGDVRSPSTVAALLVIVAVPVLLIMKQPDLGTAMVFVPMAFIMMFAGGVSGRVLIAFVLAGMLAVGCLVGALLLPEKLEMDDGAKARIERLTGLSDYQKRRIMVFLQLDDDPLNAGWNKRQSEIAVGSGGAWGKGFLKGTQNILGFLPRSVAPTDFIYSVIAEEKGFFGSVVVLLLFGVVMMSGMQTAVAAPDRLGRLLCVGIVSMFFCHVFINIAMTVGLMPITGLPLPLLSYGGSFMVVTMSSLGIVQSVHIRSQRTGVFRVTSEVAFAQPRA